MPSVILTDDIKKYEEYIPLHMRSMCYDMKWMKSQYTIDAIGDIQQSLLGHGYTDGTYPSDGDGELILLDAQLDNGDMVVGWGWVWYNK